MSASMAEVIMHAMGCERRAHYGNVEQPFCGKHGHYGQWPCPEAVRIAAALAAEGYGAMAEAWTQGNGSGQAWIKERGDARRTNKEDPPPPINPYRKAL